MLRAATPDDIPAICVFQDAPGMSEGFNPASAARLTQMLDSKTERVLLWDTGTITGFATLHLEPHRHFYAELRKFGAHPSGTGIGRAFAHALLADLFDKQGFFRVEVAGYGSNAAAVKLYKNLGFRAEGLLRQAVRKRSGARSDLILLAMTFQDWHLAQARPAP